MNRAEWGYTIWTVVMCFLAVAGAAYLISYYG